MVYHRGLPRAEMVENVMHMTIFVGLWVLGVTSFCVWRFTELGAGGGFTPIIRCCCCYTQGALIVTLAPWKYMKGVGFLASQ